MKVKNVFYIGDKTVFTGELETISKHIEALECKIIVDGCEVDRVLVEGEVLGNWGYRDLWTKEKVDIDRYQIEKNDVWLTSVERLN